MSGAARGLSRDAAAMSVACQHRHAVSDTAHGSSASGRTRVTVLWRRGLPPDAAGSGPCGHTRGSGPSRPRNAGGRTLGGHGTLRRFRTRRIWRVSIIVSGRCDGSGDPAPRPQDRPGARPPGLGFRWPRAAALPGPPTSPSRCDGLSLTLACSLGNDVATHRAGNGHMPAAASRVSPWVLAARSGETGAALRRVTPRGQR